MKTQEIKKGEIVIYKAKDGPKLEVRLQEDTVWLNLNQIASLFNTHKSGISRHLNNIFKSSELISNSTVAKIATVQTEGNRQIKKAIEYYNLNNFVWLKNIFLGFSKKVLLMNMKNLTKFNARSCQLKIDKSLVAIESLSGRP